MVDPNDITQFNLSTRQLEEHLVFWVCVAGKKASAISAALEKFWKGSQGSPFEVLRKLGQKRIANKLKKCGIGCYNNKAVTLYLLARNNPNLRTCTVEDLENIWGLGRKTSRCFIMHSRKDANCAGLDTHILKFLKDLGIQAPSSTPSSSKKYKELENRFLELCKLVRKPPARLDLLIWRVYSQHSHLKKRLVFYFLRKYGKV